MWSVGVLARSLAVGGFPLPIHEPPSQLGFKTLVVETDFAHLPIFARHADTQIRGKSPAYFSRALSNLVGICMQRRYHKRPTAKELLNHDFFKQTPPSKDNLKLFLSRMLQGFNSDQYH
jgi:serine/threonine protein kinase